MKYLITDQLTDLFLEQMYTRQSYNVLLSLII